jgi:low temperature requirement protein LtrA
MRARVSRARDEERVVTPLELFFDLVYVFAIT